MINAASIIGASMTAVVVTVSILPQTFFVERIAGGHADVHVMIGPGESPASFDPTPKEIMRLAETDLYVSIDVPMERALLPYIERSFPQVEIVRTGGGMGPSTRSDVEERGAAHEHDGKHRHATDHGHAVHGPDPHTWLSPRLAKAQAESIAVALSRIDPAHADLYQENLVILCSDLDDLDARLRSVLAPVSGQEFLVFHPAFGHLAAEYGLTQSAIEEGGLSPSPKRLATVLERARACGVGAIFIQPQFSESTARRVAREIGIEVRVLDPLSADYLNNLEAMAREIRSALTGDKQ